jgi:hypothetical protein
MAVFFRVIDYCFLFSEIISKMVYSTCFRDICLWLIFIGEDWFIDGNADCFEYLPGVRNYCEFVRFFVWISVEEIVFLAVSIIFWYIFEFYSYRSLIRY